MVFSQEQKPVLIEKDIQLPDSIEPHLVKKVDRVKFQQGWGKLKKGMSFKEVESLLGSPTAIESQVFDNSTTWHYGKRTVVFDNLKHTLRYCEK